MWPASTPHAAVDRVAAGMQESLILDVWHVDAQACFERAGLSMMRLVEPLHPDTGRTASVIFVA